MGPRMWWSEAQTSSLSDERKGIPYSAASTPSYGGPMKLINNFFNSDLSFNLRKETDSLPESQENGEVGVSGRDYALVSGDMWLQALKWHSDSKNGTKDGKSSFSAEEDMSDVYPLQLRLSIMRDTESFMVKISKKENMLESFRRACKIFCIESEPLRVWDFSGETLLYFMNDKNKMLKDSQRQPEQDMLLELQVYGLSGPGRSRGLKREDSAGQLSNGSSFKINGCADNVTSRHFRSNSSGSVGSFEVGTLGLTGLQNLGNTCFMNSALQCLAHTPKIVDYFLGDYKKEINLDNPLGMNGEIASAFGDLLKKLWAPGALPVAPRIFKSKLAHFAPQFSGFNQHDSQELLAFLLDGLHEDLNRVKCKPYNELKDGDARPDEEIADEYWRNHLARNDSIIVDVCQGQYRSTLVCPVCRKLSVTFDPFMYLSLPLPSTSMRTMTITVVKIDDSSHPSPYTITVPKTGKLDDLIQALSNSCSLGVDENLLVAEVFNNRIIRFLEESANSLSLIRDADRLVAYRMTKTIDEGCTIVFTHQQMEEHFINGKLTTVWKAFGLPLVTKHNVIHGSDIRSLYLNLLFQFLKLTSNTMKDTHEMVESGSQEVKMDAFTETASDVCMEDVDAKEAGSYFDGEFQFYLADDKGNVVGSQLAMDEPLSNVAFPGRLNVLVYWPDNLVEQFEKQLIFSLPEVYKSGYLIRRPQESVSLYNCLEAFLKEEPLGPEDMWYCPVCKKHCQASKKLDLWRLPEILVIHLKRFSYSRFSKNKLETYVDFPIHDLDLSTYIAYNDGKSHHRYKLYAISNHYGSMGGGHYTAFVHHGGGLWYDFDDSHVSPINEDKIKSSAAYVLFYRRVQE
ncbi:OLC1v1004831C2 [Oldenlandia corymbosa var. corymbosa]|uniref:Ubiquitin carboxyl-terminal hydrolase n=1 Tax=Oldenlandia corymbosa var. corymbosa TaxID=529605 RepID=A0AAV1DD71_OLDCO|nr:OLC1v1004831C2 [Oldenlandia corymbosa var. corymbosa]